jgi:hypothetical protein
MVASQQVNALWELKFIGEQERDDLDAECTAINIVSKEEILFGGRASVSGK